MDRITEAVSGCLEREIEAMFVEHRLLGASIGVVSERSLIWSKGFGFASVESGDVPNEDTIYRVGSITKTFTASAIFKLAEGGRLKVDDLLVGHITEFAAVQTTRGTVEDVTLKRLLCHLSGLVGETGDYWETGEFPTIGEFIEALPTAKIAIEPDSAFKYSNLAFTLLGEVVEGVGGRPYDEYVSTEFLQPLGMTSSGFTVTPDMSPHMATGYHLLPHEEFPRRAVHLSLDGHTAAGQLYSTVADLAKWLSVHFRTDDRDSAGARVLARRSVERMQRVQFVEPGWTLGYCLPWWAHRNGREVYIGHGGLVHGFSSQILFSPERRLGVIVLTNGDSHRASFPIAQRVLAEMSKADDARPARVDARMPVPTPGEWVGFLGRYTGLLGSLAGIQHRGGDLLLVDSPFGGEQLPPIRLDPTDEPDAFEVTGGRQAGELLRFRRGGDGAVRGFAAGGFPYEKLVVAGG